MKPAKFYRVNPFLPVKDLRATLNFYRDVLGFYEEWTFGDFDGGIRRDEMRAIFRYDPEYTIVINNEQYWFELIWFVDNVDEIYREYKEKKIEVLTSPENKPWGIREFSIKDINGYLIRISAGIEKKE
jgi:catechol 2,3-dioxygenase-like lactoylglutathione lyase family enzyme